VIATHRDLEAMVAAGTFRSDLLGRLEGETIRLPPLRERRDDLGMLIADLLRLHAGKRAGELNFSREAASAIFNYDWPRNVRELKRALERAVTLVGEGRRIHLPQLPEALGVPRPRVDAPARALPDDEAGRRGAIVESMRRHQANKTAVGREFGVARQQVTRWINQYELQPHEWGGKG